MFFLLIVKENDNNNIQMKFQVHSTNMFGLGAKTNIAKWQPPPLPLNFYSSPYSLPQGRVVNFFYHPPLCMPLFRVPKCVYVLHFVIVVTLCRP